jgi:two-component system chemotaxis response regulator CheB
MTSAQAKNIIVIGASAGGISAVSKLLSGFKSSLNAAIFVVIHIQRDALTEIILRQLQRNTTLNCMVPEDGEQIEHGQVYLAPADHQMMIETGKILVRKGPYENHWRPAIDALFRTAAAAYTTCVTGIILTGLMDDGTSGMVAIKKSGGIVIVQDPEEAEFANMPESVLQNVNVDYKAPIHEMPYILEDIYARESCEFGTAPIEVQIEASISLRMGSDIEELKQIAKPSELTCPDCGGILSVMTNEHFKKYRCFTGHTFTEKTLAQEQVKGIEESLWIAIRMMEERKNLLDSLQGYDVNTKRERASQLEIHINRLKATLLEMNNNSEA